MFTFSADCVFGWGSSLLEGYEKLGDAIAQQPTLKTLRFRGKQSKSLSRNDRFSSSGYDLEIESVEKLIKSSILKEKKICIDLGCNCPLICLPI
jgi:hypothetical protein